MKTTTLILALVAAAAPLLGFTQSVDLGAAGNFTILSKSGISTTGVTSITGNIGTSPASDTAFTGFGQTNDASNQFSRSSLVNGKLYAANYAAPSPAILTSAISDMQTAYTDAAGRAPGLGHSELNSGLIGGLTLGPGVYHWSSAVDISSDLMLDGGANDVWIFQISQTLTLEHDEHVVLSGGAQAKNIFWQVAGQGTLGSNSVFYGNILDQTSIALVTGATLNGKALAQTAVTLQANQVVSSASGFSGNHPPQQGGSFVFPSPAKGNKVTVVYNLAEVGQAKVLVWNENGDLVATVEESKLPGVQKSQIPIRDFAPGVYLYRVVLNYDSGRVERLDVQKFGVTK